MARRGEAAVAYGEQLRLGLLFGSLAVAALVVFARLATLQLPGAAVAAAERRSRLQQERRQPLAAPRGMIVARDDQALAYDRPVCEIRLEVVLHADSEGGAGSPRGFQRARDILVERVVWALGRDPRSDLDLAAMDSIRADLHRRLERALAKLDWDAAPRERARVDILVSRAVESGAALEALRGLDSRRAKRASRRRPLWSALTIHELRRYERAYPYGALFAGVVGRVIPQVYPSGVDEYGPVVRDRFGVSGLERLACLSPRGRGQRTFLVDASHDAFWTARIDAPDRVLRLATTLDVRLQLEARTQLDLAVEAVAEHYGSPPDWGAMLLVEVASGDILAMASYRCGEDGENNPYGAFAPTQMTFEPGSVVKPLTLSLALQRGDLDWEESVDCSTGYRVGGRREIRDTHVCGMLTPHGVIVNSSNIGAVRLGLRLGAEGIERYLDLYQHGQKTGIALPNESSGVRPPPIPGLSRMERQVWTGPSVCFGYAVRVTPVQLARSFLTFVSGRQRQLRLVAGCWADDTWHANPRPPAAPERFLDARTVAITTAALVGVADGEPGSTGRRYLTPMLRARGIPEGVVAGKTGTSEYGGRAYRPDGTEYRATIRTASFAGFAPAADPRFVVVCVVQKAGAASFYGGRYAAPAAGGLLLAALEWSPKAPRAFGPGRSGPGRPLRFGSGWTPARRGSPAKRGR